MPNEQNLIPFSERSESEVREIARRGGIASGASRRRKKSLKQAADYFLSLPVTDRRRAKKLERRQVNPEDIDNQMAMISGLWEAACEGDARAARVLVDVLGDDARQDSVEGASGQSLLAAIEAAAEEDIDEDAVSETE